MKILIVGGTGLISTEITRQLLARGDAVTHLNRGQSPSRLQTPIPTIVCDRDNEAAFERAIAEAGNFDAVIDMICFNAAHARSLLRAVKGRCGQILFCSTVDVYARPAERYPITEDTPYGAASDYGRDKEAAERVFFDADETDGVRVTILRPASTYGEGGSILHSLGWSSSFIDRLLNGKPVIVHGDGVSLWASCHISDVARGFLGAIGNERAYGRAYNLTGEEWMTWSQHVHEVAEAIGAPKPKIVPISSTALYEACPEKAGWIWTNFMNNNIFDNTRARTELGFEYTVKFRDGVRRVYESLVEAQAIEPWDADPAYDRLIDAWEAARETMRQRFNNL